MPPHLQLARAAKILSRRMFLKGMAMGLTVPAALRLSRMANAANSAAPKRFFLFYTPHGTAPEHYAPKISGSDLTKFALDQTNISILGPLQQYNSYVNVYQGFEYVGDGQTHDGIVNCLSGYTGADTTASRTTVDQVIGKALGVKPLILGACSHMPSGMDHNGMLFWNGTPIDPQKSPVAAFDSLFGGSSGGTTAPVSADVQLRQDLLAFTATEIQGLSSTLKNLTTEQNKLQTHLASIQAMQSGGSSSGGNTMSSCSSKPSLPTVEMVRKASAGNVPDSSGSNDYFYQASNFPLILQAQLELVAQALICNAAPIIGLMPMYATCDFDFSFAGSPGAHHSTLSHTNPQQAQGAQYNSPISIANLDPSVRVPFAKAQLWFTQQLVKYVVSVLATTDDPAAPGTKVLDNTVIFCMSEIGDGADHNRMSEVLYPQTPDSLPLVTIGKCGGAIKSGQVVQYPLVTDKNNAKGINRPATDLFLTLARAMGAGNATFPGTSGVISEVLS